MVSNKFESSDLFMPSLTGDIAYYWQGTDPNGTSTGNFSSIYTVTSSGTYYLRSQNSSGCWGGSVGVNVTVEAKPTISVMGNTNLGNLGDKVTFSSQATYDSYTWKRDGVTVGANPSYEARQEGNYTLTVSKIGVLGTAESTGVDVIGCADVDPGDENYIMSTTVLTSGITSGETTDSQISLLTSDYRSVSIQYVDGLGRSIQSVGIEASPDKKHIVQPIVYDAYGRKDIGYLPYVVTDNCGIFQSNPVGTAMVPYNLSPQFEFYQAENDNIANDIAPYAVTVFEASPLNRVLKQGAPGAAWQPVEGSGTDKIVRMAYELNVANEVRLFRLDGNGLITPSSIGYYGAGELMVSVVQDEQGNETAQYTDKRGQVVLKKVSTGDVTYPWAETYYIYDDFGNLTFVLPPEANKAIIAGDLNSVPAGFTLVTTDLIVTNANYTGGSYMYLDGASVSIEPDVTLNPDMEIIPYAIGIDFLDIWAFQYKYDHRNRMSEKRVPGAGWVYMVYDDLDRLVATQDANQRSINQWTFTKYDALSRPVLTGFYTNVAADQSAMQAVVNGYSTLFESIGSTVLGYTNNAFPSVSNANDYLSATYYDSYTNLTTDFTFTYAQELGNPATNNTKVKGQVVGSKTKMLDGSNTWLKNTMYYDDRYRVIQTVGDNQFGSTDRSTTKYDFAGRAIQTKTTHIDATATTTLAENYSYDHASRLLEIDHSMNGATAITMVKNEYNELGELIDKKLHSTDGTNFEQSVDYRYNIRGWLNRINDASLSDGENDYFGMELGYNNSLSGTGNTALYNGNISGAKWSNYNGGTGMESAYNYSYDAMNRIKEADFREKAGTWADVAKFGLNGLTYDLNGNIKNLARYHTSASTPMDDLIYTYEGNRLMSVLDNGDDTEGFKDGNTTGNDYAYDDNGNMVSDLNKDITSITYNHLNLPNVVTFTGNRSITYTYDAAGIKLKKVANDNGTAKTTQYSGGFIYEDGVLQQVATAEGRARKKDNGSYVYDYYLKDHLGNTRITFTTENEEVEYLATMETEHQTFEEEMFLNINNTRDGSLTAANYTVDATITADEVARLNGYEANRRVGPAKFMSVSRGDTIKMEAFAYHLGSYSDNGSISQANLVTSLASAFGGVNGGTFEQQGIYDLFNANGALAFVGTSGSSSAPRAYLNYILFDEELNYVDAGFTQVGNTASTHQQLTLATSIAEKGYIYVYLSNESQTDFNVYFDDFRITHTKGKVIQEDHYYPFGLNISALSSTAPLSKPNKYKFNGKEEQAEFDLGWYDFGARMFMPEIGRWGSIDPAADVLEMSSPYVYALNSPIIYLDQDGELPILINGRAACNDCRGNANYWGTQIVNTIKNSGIANPGGEFHYVDGDKSYYASLDRVDEGNFIRGNNPMARRVAGKIQAKGDFQSILSKLARDPESGKIIEKIQIYTHSRGAAFGEGYTQQLLKLISDNAELFDDPNNVVQFVLNLAPHQSGSVDTPEGVDGVSMHHNDDLLSGNKMGNTTATSSDIGDGTFKAHNVSGFAREVSSFLQSFLNNNQAVNQSTIDDFVKKMQEDYGITVTVKD